MRFVPAIAALAVILAPSVFAQDTTLSGGSTTTVTRTVVQATATSIVVRSSAAAVSTSASVKPTSASVEPTSSVIAAITSVSASASPSTVPKEYMGAASSDQSSLVVVALAGAAVIAFGL
ncbi:hypothetical protein GJ744_008218 [Endocarpon pusillum]|uniref:Uncharacterized protein n=1 Tax=Endocarpon pusillum TaxID=364733 RepID=A0A8H7AJK1_9EURO|nr:hypothetical protein GJ744_008218 [Endocarpon pusillum]